mmetsp:Transcript_110418/g.246357  ORF Transcript_110418/g.246357 Transcript_110418/m.246357 type:complete len:106 (+) Transcript_110418:370-687(+)
MGRKQCEEVQATPDPYAINKALINFNLQQLMPAFLRTGTWTPELVSGKVSDDCENWPGQRACEIQHALYNYCRLSNGHIGMGRQCSSDWHLLPREIADKAAALMK